MCNKTFLYQQCQLKSDKLEDNHFFAFCASFDIVETESLGEYETKR